VSGRSAEIALALDGDARCFYSSGLVRRELVPLRYVIGALRTVAYLVRRRPSAIIVSNPPVFPGAIAYLYGRITKAPVVLDSHPSSFALYENKKLIAAMMPLHRFLMSRVRGVIVTDDRLAHQVRAQGGRAEIVHEAPPLWRVSPPSSLKGRPQILVVGIFADDEPTDVVVDVARRLPHVDVSITGDVRKCPPALQTARPENVCFTGFLGPEDYRDAVEKAHIVIAATKLPEAVSRAANEAVFACRPLITSDTPATRRYFPFAVHVPNTTVGMTEGIEEALRRYDELRLLAEEARDEQRQRWERQLHTLRGLVAAD
jgi:glycosyltransferase involved in cell wall biosynthesis